MPGWPFLLLIFLSGKANGGIPHSACHDMLLDHGSKPQLSQAPYSIRVESRFFVQNISLKIYLGTAHVETPSFKEYYCQARTVSNTTVGEFSFDARSSTGHSCFTHVNDTVSYSDSWEDNPKRSLRLRWRTTALLHEGVNIRCTFVQNSSTFWTGVESDVIKPLRNVTVTECCGTEGVMMQSMPLCRSPTDYIENVTAITSVLTEAVNNGNNSTCSFLGVKLPLRCSYWSSSSAGLRHSDLTDCCARQGVTNNCRSFCDKNIFATMNYNATGFDECLDSNPELASCIIRPIVVDEYNMHTTEIDTTAEYSTFTDDTTYFTERSPTTATTSVVTNNVSTHSTSSAAPTSSPESAGVAVYDVTVTVQVDGATNNASLRRQIFSAVESGLLQPALVTVTGYTTVRTGVRYHEGSLVVVSEAVYRQLNDGTVPTLASIETALNNRLRANNTIVDGEQSWSVNQGVLVAHKAINGYCQANTCSDGMNCVEIGSNETVCLCERVCASGLSIGAITGIVVGTVVLIIIIVIVTILVKRRNLCKKNKKNVEISTYVNSDAYYTEPVYVDISNAEPAPPKLPPDRVVGNLPSNSITYETIEPNDKPGQFIQSFREISAGYVEGVMIEGSKTPDESPPAEEKSDDQTGYASYDVDSSKTQTEKSNEDDPTYDDRYLVLHPQATQEGSCDHTQDETTKNEQPKSPTTAKYESVSGYEFADPVRL